MASNRVVDRVVPTTIQKASQRFVLVLANEKQTFERPEAQLNAARPTKIGIVHESDRLLPTNAAKDAVRRLFKTGTRHKHIAGLG